MTDQPNPVELQKEISGHPTDHARKALCHCGKPIQYSLAILAWKHTETDSAKCEQQFAAPSLPEEGGQPRSLALDLLARAANRLTDDTAPDKTWWREYFLLIGEHMICTEEGWQPGSCKLELVAEYGADYITDEVNEPGHWSTIPRECGLAERDAAILRACESDVVFYGPHLCETCGESICKAAVAQGGMAFDYPNGPIYPNTNWRQHICPSECPRCNGTGNYARKPGQEKPCAVCDGTGKVGGSSREAGASTLGER